MGCDGVETKDEDKSKKRTTEHVHIFATVNPAYHKSRSIQIY